MIQILNRLKQEIKKCLELDMKDVNIKYYIAILIAMMLCSGSLLFLLINSGAGITKY